MRPAGNGAIYYGLGVTEHSQGTTMVMGIANLAMATGNLGREGVGVNPLRGQNNVQGSCDMGSFPHEFSGYRHVSDDAVRGLFEDAWGVPLRTEPGLRIPNMFEAALDGSFQRPLRAGRGLRPVRSRHAARHRGADRHGVRRRAGPVPERDGASYAHVFLPGSSFLEKDGTFTNAERRISRVRKVMEPLAGLADWEVTVRLAQALGYPMHYSHPSEIMHEIARLTPTFHGVVLRQARSPRQHPVAVQRCRTRRHADDARRHVRPRQGQVLPDGVRGHQRARHEPLSADPDHRASAVPVQRGRADPSHREHRLAPRRPARHPSARRGEPRHRGWRLGRNLEPGRRHLDARGVSPTHVQPGVVYTTFHFPESGANVVTTENSDWATNCPEYKVTAVQVVKVRKPDAWRARITVERGARRTTTAPSA